MKKEYAMQKIKWVLTNKTNILVVILNKVKNLLRKWMLPVVSMTKTYESQNTFKKNNQTERSG